MARLAGSMDASSSSGFSLVQSEFRIQKSEVLSVDVLGIVRYEPWLGGCG